MSDPKDRIRKIIEKTHEKDWIDIQKQSGLIKKRKHGKPEAELVKEVLTWMRTNGFMAEVYDSKATFNGKAWVQSGMKQGISDIQGVLPTGVAFAVECKAPGKLGTLRDNQREFLKKRISIGAFAIVTDSVSRLAHIYKEWSKLTGEEAKAYLFDQLP